MAKFEAVKAMPLIRSTGVMHTRGPTEEVVMQAMERFLDSTAHARCLAREVTFNEFAGVYEGEMRWERSVVTPKVPKR